MWSDYILRTKDGGGYPKLWEQGKGTNKSMEVAMEVSDYWILLINEVLPFKPQGQS